ncbi:hypothetical protein Y032_0044g1080 [Ancylostoma ceylanicum]|nr:hypothetical protein Y032_0044g1080 [Ancylostoma ceylanicum]
MRSATPAKKKPSVGRVKPIPRANQKVTSSTPAPVNATTTASLRRPQLRSGVTQTSLMRRSHIAECEARLFERTAHVEALRERVRRFLQQAAFLRSERRGNNSLLQDSGSVDEARDEPIPDVFSHMMENPQSDTSLQNALQDVLSDVKKSLKEDVNEQACLSSLIYLCRCTLTDPPRACSINCFTLKALSSLYISNMDS